jgi:hypothetical protein
MFWVALIIAIVVAILAHGCGVGQLGAGPYPQDLPTPTPWAPIEPYDTEPSEFTEPSSEVDDCVDIGFGCS